MTEVRRFTDLDDTYRAYVETAAAQGWITGYPDGRFQPYSTLSRQQMAIIMVRAMGWEADGARCSPASEIEQALETFSDRADIATVARPYVAVAASRRDCSAVRTAASSPGRHHPGSVLPGGLPGRAQPAGGDRARCAFASDYPDKTRVVIDLSRAPGTVTAAHLRRRQTLRRLHRRRHRRHAVPGRRFARGHKS